jgi:hypothetical protein
VRQAHRKERGGRREKDLIHQANEHDSKNGDCSG